MLIHVLVQLMYKLQHKFTAAEVHFWIWTFATHFVLMHTVRVMYVSNILDVQLCSL